MSIKTRVDEKPELRRAPEAPPEWWVAEVLGLLRTSHIRPDRELLNVMWDVAVWSQEAIPHALLSRMKTLYPLTGEDRRLL